MPDTPLRGRRGRDRRIAETVASDFAARHAPPSPDEEVDFDVAAVDAEVEDARRPPPKKPPSAKPRTAAASGSAGSAGQKPASETGRKPAATASRTCPRSRRCSPRPARSPASASDSGASTDDPRRTGRHVGLVVGAARREDVPRRDPRPGAVGERLVWIARDAEIGDRVAEELGAWLGDPDAVAVLEPRTALAYERSELDRRRDGGPGRGARGVAERPGAGPRGRASRRSSSTRSTRPTCRAAPARAAGRRRGSTRTRCCASCSISATCR